MKKTIYKPRAFESVGGDKKHAAIYISMLFSPAFQSLSNRQQILYIYVKGRYYGTRKPGKDYPEVNELQGNDLFYFPFNEAVKTGKYTANMRREFYGVKVNIKMLKNRNIKMYRAPIFIPPAVLPKRIVFL